MSSRPLRELIPEILKHVKDTNPIRVTAKKLKGIYEGNLTELLQDKIASSYSNSAKVHTMDRICPVNVIKPLVDKLASIYEEPPARATPSLVDQTLLDDLLEELELDDLLMHANQAYELQDFIAIEPYIDDQKINVRLLDPCSFTVFSDDIANPNKPTVLIKFMGECSKLNAPRAKTKLMYIYSATEFLAIDADGNVRDEHMKENPEGINPHGKLPAVIIKRNKSQLLRDKPNTDLLELALNIPLTYTDLAFGIKFSTFSVFTVTNASEQDIAGLTYSPNAIWNFTSPDDGSKPVTIDTLKPDINIPQVLEFIDNLTRQVFASKNIKADLLKDGGTASSGLSLMIQEADVTSAVERTKTKFKAAELTLLHMIKDLQNYGADTGVLLDPRKFTDGFKPTVVFPRRNIMETEKDRIETIKLKKDAGFTSNFRAIREANQDVPESEVENIEAEIMEDTPNVRTSEES